MAKLSDTLRPASFRGVPFKIDDADRTAGRRTQVHEYPQRDDPYVEDLGRATRELNITAFVVGADYVAQADKLLAACEEAGSGTLVHPWLGSMEVTLKEPARASYSRALGQVTIALSFIRGSHLSYPSATDSTPRQSAIAADGITSAVQADFAKTYKVVGHPDFVSAAASADINKIFAMLAQPKLPGLNALGFANTALASAQSVLLLINDSSALAFKMLDLMGVSTISAQITQSLSLIQSVLRLSSHGSIAPVSAPSGATPATLQQYANTNALNALTRRAMLANSVGLSSVVPVTVHDETIALRNMLSAALDTEALDASDDVYQALTTARAKIWIDLTARARNAARLTSITPAEVMPMLAISSDYYGDAGRAAEIITRNNVRHPLFVPVAPLKMLAA